MDPATSIVASVSVRALTKPPDDAWASPVSGMLLIYSLREGDYSGSKQPGTKRGESTIERDRLPLYDCGLKK
jgi:hypothetical protein